MQCGVQPDYVLDKMKFYEIDCLIENLWMKNKEAWEQTRVQAYITAQTQSTKELNIKKLMSFPWDREEVNDEKGDSKEDIKAMMEEVNKYTEKLNNKI